MMKKYLFIFMLSHVLWAFSSQENAQKHSFIKLLQQIAIGAVTGVAEVSVNQPTILIKNRLQRGKTLPKIPKELPVYYRGYLTAAGSMAPITAVQVATNTYLKKVLSGDNDEESLPAYKKMLAAFVAGGLSGLVSSPAEMAILHQQEGGKNLFNVAQHIVRSGGISRLYRGFTPIALRDAGFTLGYLALADTIAEQLPLKIESQVAKSIIGGIPAGVIAGIITHPGDTVSTLMKSDIEKKELVSTLQTIRKIIQDKGPLFLYKGFVPRTGRICIAIPLLSYLEHILQKFMSKKNA